MQLYFSETAQKQEAEEDGVINQCWLEHTNWWLHCWHTSAAPATVQNQILQKIVQNQILHIFCTIWMHHE